MKLGKLKHILKPFDLIFIVLIFAASFIPVAVLASQVAQIPDDATMYAVVFIRGEEIDRLPLYEGARQEILYTHEDGLVYPQFNLVEIKDGAVRVKADNSPGQVGVNMGWASNPGQTIIVLPHSFWIQIEAVGSVAEEDEIIRPF